MTRPSVRARLRVGLLATVLAATSFAVTAAPAGPASTDPGDDPLAALVAQFGEAIRPLTALAGFCADEPAFTGRLTASATSTTAVTRITSPDVYGYLSNVDDDWSCTAYYRFSALAWNLDATLGRFNWGALIHSTSVACNWGIGSTDYLKANDTTDCPDSDAEYAMEITLTPQQVYVADVAHNSAGDFSWAHSDCGTYYGVSSGDDIGERHRTNESFATGNVDNRPGANCDPIVLDATGTAQTVTYDATAPTLSITAPAAGGPHKVSVTSYQPVWRATDAVAGFGGAYGWSLQRQTSPINAVNTCSPTWSGDGEPITGFAQTQQTGPAVGLLDATCYRWVLTAEDQNGNGPVSLTSATLVVDRTSPTVDFTSPDEGTTTTVNTTGFAVTWSATDPQTGVASSSLQRQRVAATSAACIGTFTNDGSPVTTGSPSSQTLADGFCYQWLLTLTDGAGNVTVGTSGKVYVNTTSPTATFGAPASGTTTYQPASGITVSWTESAPPPYTITSRSLSRERGPIPGDGSCDDVSWASDGTAVSSASPVNVTGLASGYAYRWTQTLANSYPKSSATISGCVIVDDAAPTAALSAPAANSPLSGEVAITGTAADALTFQEYEIEVGAGTNPSAWTSLGVVASPVPSGTLAAWQPGTASGVHTIRLTVRDRAGNAATATRTVVLENARRGEEAFFARVPFELGGGWTLDVGAANGEARLSRGLFSIPSYGPAQALSLAYSSLEPSATGRFGTGWHSNLTQYLTFDATDIVVWHRDDGGRVPFGKVAGTWTPLAGHFETLALAASEYTITTKDQTRYVFESTGAGRLKRIENRFGKALTLAWSTNSATATDASGRVTNLTIDAANNRITGVTDSAGRSWSFGYTGTALTSVTDPAGKATTLGYTSGLLTSVSRSRSQAVGSPETLLWTIGYTSSKVTSVLDPIGDATSGDPAHTFSYGAGTTDANLLVDYATATRTTTTYTFDTQNRGWSESESTAGSTTTYPRNDAGLVTTETRPAGTGASAATEYTYDARGNVLTQVVDIDATTTVRTAYSYNATNDLLTVSEADNDASVKLVTRHVYDGAGHITSTNVNCTTSGTTPPSDASTCTGAGTQDSATNLITSFTYTSNDQVETETDPRAVVTRRTYDTHGNETTVTQNYVAGQSATADRNVVTTMAYDQGTTAGKAGLPTSTTDPVGNVSTLTYDLLGRRLTEVLPGDSSIPALTTTTVYDELGNVLTETASWTPLGGGSAVSRTTTHDYDLRSREVLVTDPAGQQTTTTYDAASNPVETDAAGVTTTRAFDELGQLESEIVEGGTGIGDGVTSVTYDDGGNPELVAAPTGVDTTLEHTYTGLPTSEAVGALDPQQHTYDRLGRELTSTSPEGIVTTRTYDRAGRLLTVTVGGETTSYTYDRAGNQLTVTDAAGIVTTTVYDPLGRATQIIVNDVANPSLPSEDVTTTTYYDAAGQTIAVRDPKGITNRTIPNARGLAADTIANCTDSGTSPTAAPATCTGAGTHNATTNITTLVAYDGSGAVVSTTTADGTSAEATIEAAYDAAGRTIATKDPRGTITRTFFDADGRITKTVVNCTTSGTTIPADWAGCTGAGTQDGTFNLTMTYTYDGHGNQATVTAPNGRVTKQVYDDADRLVTRTEHYVDGNPGTQAVTGRPDDIATVYYYDAAGRQAAVVTDNADRTASVVTRYLYDDDGRLTREIRNCVDSPVGSPASCTGTDTAASAVRNLVTDYAYDARGNRTKTTLADPSATATGTGVIVTRYAYDDADRLCRVVENSTLDDATFNALADRCTTAITGTATTNLSTRYTYDGTGNLASMIDANGNTTTCGYDAAGRMTSRTDALAGAVTYGYDALGNRTRQTNRVDPPLSDSITWTYDAAGRMTSRTADGVTITYTYDANGNRLTASDGTLVITTTYDRLDRPLTVDDEDAGTTADTTYTYSLTAPGWTDPTGTYAVTLDTFDRAVTLNDPHNASDFTWSYGPTGLPLTGGLPNGTTTTFTYDAIGRETSRATKAGATNRMTHAATYNRAGHILSATETVTTGAPAVTTYAYDQAGRLTGYTPPTGSAVTYGWDAVPNRTSVTTGGTPTTTTYDAANRPTSTGYAYDADGRLTARPTAGGQTLLWDDLGRLTQVKNAAGTVTLATYTYDPLDRLRLVDRGSTDQVRFRYVGTTTAVVQILDHDAATVARNIATGWGGERLADWTGAGSDLRLYGTNAHHDVTFTTGAAGTVTATARYDPWGTLASSSGTLPEFGFQGSFTDATTGLLWVVTRWYAPAEGRFLSEDSLLGEPSRPASRHLYAYGEGEPVGRWDPDGRATRPGATQWRLVQETVLNQTDEQLFILGNALQALCWISAGASLSAGGGVAVASLCLSGDLMLMIGPGTLRVKNLVRMRLWRAEVPSYGWKAEIRPGLSIKGNTGVWVARWAKNYRVHIENHFVDRASRRDSYGSALYSRWQRCAMPKYTGGQNWARYYPFREHNYWSYPCTPYSARVQAYADPVSGKGYWELRSPAWPEYWTIGMRKRYDTFNYGAA